MKKLIYIPVAAGVLAFGGIVFANSDTEQNAGSVENKISKTQDDSSKKQNQKETMTFEQISAAALEIAGGTVTDIELDDDGKLHYDVEIDHEGYEYDFEFDAYTGEVLEQKREKEDDRDDSEEQTAKSSAKQNLISSDEAAKAALAKSNGGTVEELELDHDDGIAHYEIEIKNGRDEDEITVNAEDGSIIEHEKDDDDEDDDD